MGNKKRKQCRFQSTCLRVETNYRTVTCDQKAFGWTEDKVIFIDPDIFFYRENFKRGLFAAFTPTTENIGWK